MHFSSPVTHFAFLLSAHVFLAVVVPQYLDYYTTLSNLTLQYYVRTYHAANFECTLSTFWRFVGLCY